MSDIYLRILLSAQDAASSVIKNVAGAFGPIGAAAVVAGAALVGIGVAATKEAADFQTAMLSNVAHAGLAKSEFQSVSDAILAMAPAVGRSPTQLAEAMYPILSAFSGIQNQAAKSAISLDTLKMSFQTVAGTTVDGTAVANAAVGTFNALGLATNNVSTNTARMKNLFDVMDKTVQLGNMQWDQYKNVISKLAVSIQGTGVSFNEASAALATMTNEGFSAQKAQTYLSNTFTTAAIKTDAMAKHAKKLGISFDEQKYSAMNLADKIHYLNEVTGGNKQKILAMLGNNATALKTFNALLVGVDAYKSGLDGLNHAQGALKASFDTASQGLKFQMSQMKAAGDALLITIGTQLLPVLSDFVKKIIPIVQQFTQWLVKSGALKFAAQFLAEALSNFIGVISGLATTLGNIVSFFQQNEWAMDALKAVLIAFAIVVAPMVVAALIGMATAAWAAAVPIIAMALPFIALGLVIAAFVFGVIEAYKHWGAITDWISNKTEQMHIKMQIQDSQAAVKKDQQQKQSAQNTLKNLEKEKADILTKLKQTHDAATKAELQHQLEMTQRQIDGQNDRIKQMNTDIAKQKAKQKQLHDDLIESQKNLGQRIDDAVNTWTKNAEDTFDKWLATLAGNINTWTAKAETAFDKFFGNIFSGLGTFVHNFLSMLGAWKDQAIWTIISWKNQALEHIDVFITQMKTTFTNLPGQALQWGQNLIQGFINGINNMVGGVTGAISNIAQIIADHMPHSPAKRGPLMALNSFGTGLVNTFARDITSTSPRARAAAEHMMSGVASSIKSLRLQIAHADLIGNYAQAKALRAQRHQDLLLMRKFRDLVILHGYRMSTLDPNNPINFAARATRAARGVRAAGGVSGASSSGAMTDALLQQIIVLLGQGFGISTAGGVSSIPYYTERSPLGRRAGRAGGGGGGGTTFNITINTMAGSRAEVRRLADLIEQEVAQKFRAQTPGYSSGGVF